MIRSLIIFIYKYKTIYNYIMVTVVSYNNEINIYRYYTASYFIRKKKKKFKNKKEMRSCKKREINLLVVVVIIIIKVMSM